MPFLFGSLAFGVLFMMNIKLNNLLLQSIFQSCAMDINELARVIPKNVTDWSNKDVLVWLDYIHLPQLSKAFRQKKIEGWMILSMQEQVLLAELRAIKSNIIKKKLRNWFKFLTQNIRNYQSVINQIRFQARLQEEYQYTRQQTMMSNEIQHDFELTQMQVNQKNAKNQLLASTQKESVPTRHQNLFVYELFGMHSKFYNCGKQNITIGKSAQNLICLVDVGIEMHHCTIIHQKNIHYIKAEPTDSGVWIQITARLQIDREYILEMGNTHFKVLVQSKNLHIKVIKSQSGTNDLCEFSFDHTDTKMIRIGRSIRYELSFATDTTMSSLHGKFIFADESWYFEDMTTLNGTWYRCQKEVLITHKLIFRIGRSQYLFNCRLADDSDEKSISSKRSNGICKICKKVEKNSFVSPCSHSNSCFQCAQKTKICVQCNRYISEVHKIFRV